MTPQQQLFSHCKTELSAGRSVVRAVIVRTWGSTPRECGADMILDSAGGLLGTVGGGCGEAEVYEVAQEMLAGGPVGVLLHVDLTEDPEEGGGKVCGGRFDVLLHLLHPEAHSPLVEEALGCIASGRTASWKTTLPGVRSGFWREGRVRTDFLPSVALERLETSEVELVEGESGATFYEPIGLARRLIIVGAGHIARPLCSMAALVGYQVVVIDDRQEYAREEFFPAAALVKCGEYRDVLPALAQGELTSVVLVTRGHKHDQDCLRLIANSDLEYVGMIGSRRRIDAVFAELLEEGYGEESLSRVSAPIGLEIGAQTPAEIAVSILAQMIRNRRLEGDPRAATDRRRPTKSL